MWKFSFFFSHFLLPSSWTKMPWRQCCAAAGYYYIHVFLISAHYNQKHEKIMWYVQKWRHYCSSKQFLFDWRSILFLFLYCARGRKCWQSTLTRCQTVKNSWHQFQMPMMQMYSQSPSLGVGVHAESQRLLGCVNFSNSQQKVCFRCNKNESDHGIAVLTVAPQLGCVM